MRILLSVIALALGALLTTYFVFPGAMVEPLVGLNRQLSGLTEKTVKVGAHEVHYLEGGSGETVVLLHGIFAEKDHWVDFARGLTGRYRVIAPDLPGFGESGRHAGEAYDYTTQVQRLGALLDALGIERAHIAGNSMGGTIASLFAVQNPGRVRSVGLIGAPHGIRSPRASEMDAMVDAGQPSPLIAHDAAQFERMLDFLFVKRPFLPRPILLDAQAGAIANASSNRRLWDAQMKDRHLLDAHIAAVQGPVLVLWGSADRLFDVSGADALRGKLKTARVEVLQGVGHLPMMERPKETSQVYAAFLASSSAPSIASPSGSTITSP